MILQGDCREVLKTLESQSVNTCVTSPPYWGLRDYGVDGQLGLEPTPEEYVKNMVEVFREVRRVLRDDGTLWLNLGDCYAGNPRNDEGFNERWHGKHFNSDKQSNISRNRPKRRLPNNLKPKDLVGIPWMVAFALRADGWYLRSDIVWHKPNAMPESVTDRPTKAHEYIFLLSKSAQYYYDHKAIKEKTVTKDNSFRDRDNTKLNQVPGRTKMGGLQTNNYDFRNKRSVWSIPTRCYAEAHFATYPPDLIEPCILAGCPAGGVVLDPFGGSGTTKEVANKNNRECILIELNPEYIELAEKRTEHIQPVLNLEV